MKFYFLSSRPAALYVGGAYFGVVNDFEKFAEVPLEDKLLAQFVPEGALPVAVFLDENLRFTPPQGVEIYLLKDGAAIFVKDYPPADFSLKLISQKREGNRLATLFCQGALTLAVEKGNELFTHTLSHEFTCGEVGFFGELPFVRTPKKIAVFSAECRPLLTTDCTFVDFQDGKLSLICPLSDSLRRAAKQSFQVQEGTLVRTEYTLIFPKGEPKNGENPHGLIPYAFFESILVGGDFQAFLSDELKEKAGAIKAFLGDFCAVTLTNDPCEVGLVHQIKPRVFEVRYARVQLGDGKICDVHI